MSVELGMLLVAILSAQPAETRKRLMAQESRDLTITSTVNLVLLDVSVKTTKGSRVPDLPRDKFHVFDNGVEQPITVFENEDAPVTLGVVIDHSGSMRRKRHDVVSAAIAMIRESNSADELFSITFNEAVHFSLPVLRPFTHTPESLEGSVLATETRGRTALYDAVSSGLKHLERGTRMRKALVVISDGRDNASMLTDDEVLKSVLHSAATIYTIGIYDREEKERNPGFLKRLSELTGGEAHFPEDLGSLRSACSGIAYDIRHRYSLGFKAPDLGEGEIRKIRVSVAPKDQKLVARCRRSYMIPSGKRGEP